MVPLDPEEDNFHQKPDAPVPIADRERTEKLEQHLMKICNIEMSMIAKLTDQAFENFLDLAMSYDTERGLGAGQIPHIRYIHSEAFEKWEDELWDHINLRLKELPDGFFKIT
jgi:hypothetical protein